MQVIARLEHPQFVVAAVISPDGRRVASLSVDNVIYIWDVDSQKVLFTKTHQSAPVELALSRDGAWAASGDDLGSVYLWDFATG